MPKPTKGKRLGGSAAHQRLMLSNLATALFEHGRITTTETRARRLRPVAEKLITKAKRGDLHNRREVLKTVHDKSVVHRLFTEIGPMMAERPGGYTRITKIGPRKGDNAPMAVIELVTEAYSPKAPSTKRTAAPAPAPMETEVEGTEAEAVDTEPADVETVGEQAPVEAPASDSAKAPPAPAEVEAEGVDGETEVLSTEAADVATADEQAQGDAAQVETAEAAAEVDETAAEDEGTDSVKE